MRTLFVLIVGALVLTSAQPSFAQTTPAPALFTPAAGWVQLPRGFMLTELKNLWQGPKTGKNRAGLFGQAVLPLPAGIVGAGIAQLKAILAKPQPKTKTKSKSKSKANSDVPFTAKTVPATLCGGNANISTISFGKGSSAAILETVVLSKNGLTYASVYARPNGGAANTAIETAMRTSCPLPNGDLANATPPAGWTALQKGLDFELAGVWIGNAPMQIVTLLQGHGIPSPDMIAGMFEPVVSSKRGQVQYRIATHHVKFCGAPGVLVNTTFNMPPGFGLSYDIAAVQGTTATYILSYLHPSDYNDPAAQQSLLTLCGGPPPPEPSAMPSASPGV